MPISAFHVVIADVARYSEVKKHPKANIKKWSKEDYFEHFNTLWRNML
jgi:hypothetical protein